MIKLKFSFLIVTFFATIFLGGHVLAQENLSGGRGSNLVLKTGNLTVDSQDMVVKLHTGFAEISQTYVFSNSKNHEQEVVFGFPYFLSQKDMGLENLKISIDDENMAFDSTKEFEADRFTFWKSFRTTFGPNQKKTIRVSHWQLNGANFRGLRTFSYGLRKKLPGTIGQFNLQLVLADGISLKNFDKTSNPDFDLKLQPIGGQVKGDTISWQWQNFEPGFDMEANFYVPWADLSKVSNLEQSSGLYTVTSTENPTQAWQLTDSSYLTSWSANFEPETLPSFNLGFDQTKIINQISIIPGKANSLEDFTTHGRPKELQLVAQDGTNQIVTLADALDNQSFSLNQPVTTDQLQIKILSIYDGKTPNEVFVSEFEVGQAQTVKEIQGIQTQTDQSNDNIWINLWRQITNFFHRLFS